MLKILVIASVLVFLYFLIGWFTVDRQASFGVLVAAVIVPGVLFLSRRLTSQAKRVKNNKLSWAIAIALGVLSGPVSLIVALVIIDVLSISPLSEPIRSWAGGCQSGLQAFVLLGYVFLACLSVSIVSTTINVREKRRDGGTSSTTSEEEE